MNSNQVQQRVTVACLHNHVFVCDQDGGCSCVPDFNHPGMPSQQ